jgi:hypothetical protein
VKQLQAKITPHGIIEIHEMKFGGGHPIASFAPMQIIQNAKLAKLNSPYHWAISQLKIMAEMVDDRIESGGSIEFVAKETRRIIDGMQEATQ